RVCGSQFQNKVVRYGSRLVFRPCPMISLEMCPAVSFSAKILTIPAAFFESDPPQKTYTPVGLRAPEQILGDPASRAADIWAFGILVFEIVRGHTVFEFASRAKDRANI